MPEQTKPRIKRTGVEAQPRRATGRTRSATHPEVLFISTVLTNQDHTMPAAQGVTRDWFHGYQKEWRFIESYVTQHQRTPSVKLFATKFPLVNVIEVDDIEYAITSLREHHTKQGLIELLGETADRMRQPGVEPKGLIADVNMGLRLLSDQVAGVANDVDVLAEWEDTYRHVMGRVARSTQHGQSGIPTGFPTLDLITGGLQPSELWIPAARLGQGKSWTLLYMACSALRAHKTVQYFTLEMSRHQVSLRIHAFLSSEYGKQVFKAMDLANGKNFDLNEYKVFLKHLPSIMKGKLIVNDTSRGKVTALSMASSIERHHPDVFMLDYITLMAKKPGDWTEVATISAEMKGLCTLFDIPGVCAAQIGRGGADKRSAPGPEHLAGADAIGQDADGVLTMVQRSQHVMSMRLAKYRHGRDGQEWFCEFRPNTGMFKEVSGDRARDLMAQDQEAKDE